jgi:hypothetical protein
MILDDYFPLLANIDAIDGSAQAWSIPGGWGHVVVIQEHTGTQDADGAEILRPSFIGIADAEGAVVMSDDSQDTPSTSNLAAALGLNSGTQSYSPPRVTAFQFDRQTIVTFGDTTEPLTISDNVEMARCFGPSVALCFGPTLAGLIAPVSGGAHSLLSKLANQSFGVDW